MFSEKDLKQSQRKGISEETLIGYIRSFENGFPEIKLDRAATANDGIDVFNADEISELIDLYDKKAVDLTITKFVPASGAASRMFKHLFEFSDELKKTNVIPERSNFKLAFDFFEKIENFAFFLNLERLCAAEGIDLKKPASVKDYITILDFLLQGKGMDYSNQPKALIKFHDYNSYRRFAFEEHLVEAFMYASGKNSNSTIHFTVSPQHLKQFKDLAEIKSKEYSEKYGVNIKPEFSLQDPATDTLAVDTDNKPFRKEDKSLLFRPGGHGALIRNLDRIKADVVFVKNIDNVVKEPNVSDTVKYKKLIGGKLLQIRERVHDILSKIHSDNLSEKDRLVAIDFVKAEFKYEILDNNDTVDQLFSFLNKPIRVCGMVKNEGEPGGGPFWVKGDKYSSLQIIESSQISKAEDQQKIAKAATHFNPVDLVCSYIDFKGDKFELSEFIDHNTGFISSKSYNGKDIKALELPGLWNGAMANWLTLFVEVPLSTFNPVKTVNDLLRLAHR